MNSGRTKKPNRTARNGVLNILVMPGMGSLMSGRWFAGIGQMALAIAGSGLMLVWLYKILEQYYGLMFQDVKSESVGWIGEIGGVLLAISWSWSLLTSFSLFREAAQEAEAVSRAPLKAQGAPPVLPVPSVVPGWQREGEVISRVFEFKDFPAALAFVNDVGRVAEQVQHHPDIDIRWNKVRLALTTHDAGGLTEKDFAMARECDALADR